MKKSGQSKRIQKDRKPKNQSRINYLQKLLAKRQYISSEPGLEEPIKKVFREVNFIPDKYLIDVFTYKTSGNNGEFQVPMVILSQRFALHYDTSKKLFFKKPLGANDMSKSYSDLSAEAQKEGQAITPEDLYNILNTNELSQLECQDEGIEFQTDSEQNEKEKPVFYKASKK